MRRVLTRGADSWWSPAQITHRKFSSDVKTLNWNNPLCTIHGGKCYMSIMVCKLYLKQVAKHHLIFSFWKLRCWFISRGILLWSRKYPIWMSLGHNTLKIIWNRIALKQIILCTRDKLLQEYVGMIQLELFHTKACYSDSIQFNWSGTWRQHSQKATQMPIWSWKLPSTGTINLYPRL